MVSYWGLKNASNETKKVFRGTPPLMSFYTLFLHLSFHYLELNHFEQVFDIKNGSILFSIHFLVLEPIN